MGRLGYSVATPVKIGKGVLLDSDWFTLSGTRLGRIGANACCAASSAASFAISLAISIAMGSRLNLTIIILVTLLCFVFSF